jgi:hypothetical protein
MGLAKGQARRISVDGRSFRWTISRARQASAGEVDVVVELADQPKQRMVASVRCRDFWLDFPDIVESRKPADMRECDRLAGMDAYRPVTPRVVEQIIREAIARGCRPDVPVKPLRFDGTRAATATAAALLRRNVKD